jgi:hypothetical protein
VLEERPLGRRLVTARVVSVGSRVVLVGMEWEPDETGRPRASYLTTTTLGAKPGEARAATRVLLRPSLRWGMRLCVDEDVPFELVEAFVMRGGRVAALVVEFATRTFAQAPITVQTLRVLDAATGSVIHVIARDVEGLRWVGRSLINEHATGWVDC